MNPARPLPGPLQAVADSFEQTGEAHANGRLGELATFLEHLDEAPSPQARGSRPWEVALLAGALGFSALGAWVVLGPAALQAAGVAESSAEAFLLVSRGTRWLVPGLVLAGLIALALSRRAASLPEQDVGSDRIQGLLLPVLTALATDHGTGSPGELDLDLTEGGDPWARLRLTLPGEAALVLELRDQRHERPKSAPDLLRRGVRIEWLAPPGSAPRPVPEPELEPDEDEAPPEGLDSVAWSAARRGGARGVAVEGWRSSHQEGDRLSPAAIRALLDRLAPGEEADDAP